MPGHIALSVMTGVKIWLRAIKAKRVVPRTIVVRPRNESGRAAFFVLLRYIPLIEYEALEKEGGGGGKTIIEKFYPPPNQTQGLDN